MQLRISDSRRPSRDEVVALYQSVGWSAAANPDRLLPGLLGSHSLITAWLEDDLVGLGNAISDGHLVVFFPHLVVHAEHQGRGIGAAIMRALRERYRDFHEQALIADGDTVEFYRKLGFERAGRTVAMWIYAGTEH